MGRGSAYQSGGLAWTEVHEVKKGNFYVSWAGLDPANTGSQEVQYLTDALDLVREKLGDPGLSSVLVMRKAQDTDA